MIKPSFRKYTGLSYHRKEERKRGPRPGLRLRLGLRKEYGFWACGVPRSG
jgi:hypothetical protein